MSMLVLLTCGHSALAADHTGVIQTRSGPIRGLVSQGVEAYLGIPYARAPEGALRWRAPQPPARWNSVLDAARFGSNCYQAPPQPFGPYTQEFLITPPVSENCLFLNIWVPAAHVMPKPVYVFIHGGGFGSGSGSIPIYNGSKLAARGVVVVTLNYRLGVFGFLALPELTRESQRGSSGNYGVQDVIAALRWVQDNIARFGGDPTRVTLAGQSAGAMAVNDLLVSKPARGLFARAVAESGTAAGALGMGATSMPSLREAEGFGLEFADRIGHPELQALRAMSADRLNELAQAPPPAPGKPPPALRFVPNVDGSVIAVAPTATAALESNVPFITGWNAAEGPALFAAKMSAAAFEAQIRQRYGNFAERILALYPHGSDQEASDSANVLARDRTRASLLIFSQLRAKSSGQTVYDYLFDHPYPIPETAKYGAFHTAEVPYVFGALVQQGRHFSDDDRTVSRQLQAYWVNFMLHGDPNGGGLSHWGRATEQGPTIMELGDQVGPQPAVSTPARLTLWRDFFTSASAGQF